MTEPNIRSSEGQAGRSALPVIASLWVCGRLQVMQHLSIQSFLAHGHPYHLYVYEDIDNVPAGVTVLDGSQVVPRERIFRHSAAAGPAAGSYAGFADFFRYNLLLKKGGYWVDTDMVCLRAFDFPEEVVISSERDPAGRARPNSGVLRSPRGSPFAEFCVRGCSQKKPELLQWGEIGPVLVQEAVAKFRLEPFVLPPDTFCPIDFFALHDLFSPGKSIPEMTHGVHLWNEMWRQYGLDPSASYHPQCLYERFKGQYLKTIANVASAGRADAHGPRSGGGRAVGDPDCLLLSKASGHPGRVTGEGFLATAAELLASALRYHQGGAMAHAEQLYRKILQVDPQNVEALHLLGLLAGQAGRNDLAIEYLSQALRLRPDFAGAHYNLGVALEAQGKLEEAAASYRQALRLRPSDTTAHYNLGVVLKAEGKLEEAAASYRQALALKLDNAEAHLNLGNVLKEQGKVQEAMGCFLKALAFKPDLADAHNNLGIVLQFQGKLDQAVASLQQALALKPNYAEAHNNLGNALQGQGRLEEAVASYQQALRLAPNYADAHHNLGNALQGQGRLEEAVASYQQVLRLAPNYADAHYNLGNALWEQGKLEEAVASYKQALRLKPGHAEAHNNLVSILAGQGRLVEELASDAQALTLEPDLADPAGGPPPPANGLDAAHPHALPFPLVVSTVSRPQPYLRQTLATLAPEHTVVLMVGSLETSYLDGLRPDPRLRLVTPAPAEYALIAGQKVHRRAAWNYWRCLRYGRGGRYLVVLEDDVRCARGWERRLRAAVAELSEVHADFVLSLFYPYPRDSAPTGCAMTYPKVRYFGTLGVLFAGRALPEFAEHLYRWGVLKFLAPYDLLLQDYLVRRDVPLFATVPSLVQHMGVATTGLSGFRFHTTPWFVEDVEDWRP